jgi:ABC-2 type transport system ATP-binding protein
MHLRIDALTRHFGPVEALRGVSFEVGPGEIVGLIGPNGAGKSTLLSCIGGLDAPDSGHIYIEGTVASAATRRATLFTLADRSVPWAGQTAAWTLDLARELFGASEDWRTTLAPALQLDAFVRAPLGELSKGQRQRVLLTLALLVPRAVTLIDEPFDGLDPRQSRAFAALVRERTGPDRSFVLSIHSMSDAARTCDRHVILHDGRVLMQGTLDALRAQAGLGETADLEEIFLARA